MTLITTQLQSSKRVPAKAIYQAVAWASTAQIKIATQNRGVTITSKFRRIHAVALMQHGRDKFPAHDSRRQARPVKT